MKKRKKKNIRIGIQIFFFGLIGLIAINKSLSETGAGIPFLSEASLHALCPFGGVVALYNLLTLGTFIQKIHMSSVILMSIIFILAIFFGPVFCGWVCPLGSMQEWIGKLGRKIFKKKYNHLIPIKIDKKLRYLRYGVLLWVVFVTARSGYLLFANVDPYNAMFTFWSDEVALPSVIILIITFLSSFLIERPWCKYACPYGALLGISNKIRIFKIRRDVNTCIDCQKCDHQCPMNIQVSNQEIVTNHQCISCFECTSERSCPKPNTVVMATATKKSKKLQETPLGNQHVRNEVNGQ
ncbi:MAG: 4Fe-4S binding protein [Mobilitalea sp.]